MVFTVRDIEILKLICWCKNLPPPSENIFNDVYNVSDIKNLEYAGLVYISKNKKYIRPRPSAYRFLESVGCYFKGDLKPQTKQRVLDRRDKASRILLTFYCAGIEVFGTNLSDNTEDNIYIASFAARNKNTENNPFGSTKFYGIFYTPNMVYIVFYVDDTGVYFKKELALFHSFIEKTNIKSTGIIFMGSSTLDIGNTVFCGKRLNNTKKVKNNADSFEKVFSITSLPVYFIPTGKIGTQIIRFLSMPDYRKRLAKMIMRGSFKQPYWDLPDTDTIHYIPPNNPAVIALDMDIKRIDRAIITSNKKGFDKIAIYALPEQASFLKYKYANAADVMAINIDGLNEEMRCINIKRNESIPYFTKEGNCIEVSDFALRRKSKT